MTAEQKTRPQIERQLEQAGWIVQDYRQMNFKAGLGVAVREFPLSTGFVDYMLYADAKAIGVVEAKPEGFGLMGVAEQSAKYLVGLPRLLPSWEKPLPFAFESNGTECRFTNCKEPDARSRSIFNFHRPEELIRIVKLDKQVRGHLREMPPWNTGSLWKVQIDSINNLEKSLALNKPRALIQMATGSGKTFTAVNFCYRLIKYAEAKRIHTLPKHDNYGSPRMHKELNRVGVTCCENTVAKLMQREGIRAKVARRFKVQTTESKHDLPIAPNRLNQDLRSLKIVGWAVGTKIDAALAVNALDQAITLRQPKRGLIVHNDRGSQFASLLFQNRLSKHGCLRSMSRKGNCYDNAPMESFFKTFKTEEVYQSDYQSHDDVVRGTIEYLERFYNATRLHSSLGYLSPIEFEQSLRSKARRMSFKALAD